MIIIGGECEKRWKAAAKREAIEQHEAKIDDFPALQKLHRRAKSIAQGTGSQRIGRIKAVSNQRFEAFELVWSSLGLYPARSLGIYPTRREARNAIKLAALDVITSDIDVEMEEHGGRYQSLPLKQPKGHRKRIIDELVAWARKNGWAVSPRRVKECWDYFRRIEREVSSDLSDEQ